MNVKSYTNYRVGERFWKNFSFKFYAVLAACAFLCLASAARTVGHFTSELEAKSASSSGVPMPSCSKQAACAFLYCPAPAARLFGGFASSCKAK
ncbi:hypothetical protein OCF10_28340, partial [Bacillus cereus]|nr:hypothetical protein [Bacillus cereus]